MTLQTLLNKITQPILDNNPFGLDYELLALAAYQIAQDDEHHDGHWSQVTSNAVHRLLAPFLGCAVSSQQTSRWAFYLKEQLGQEFDFSIAEGQRQAADKILDLSKNFLPGKKEWLTVGKHQSQYPASSIGALHEWLAHRSGNLIASAGPVGWSHYTPEKFLELLVHENVKVVLALGVGDEDFINYWNAGAYGEVVVESKPRVKEGQALGYVLTIRFGEVVSVVEVYNIELANYRGLNLDLAGLDVVLQLFDKQKTSDETVLVHCAYGVGRTGQLRLMFDLLNDLDACAWVDKIIAGVVLIEQDLQQFSYVLEQGLHRIRKIRFALQSPTQFIRAFDMFILLRARQKGLDSSAIDVLRRECGLGDEYTCLRAE